MKRNPFFLLWISIPATDLSELYNLAWRLRDINATIAFMKSSVPNRLYNSSSSASQASSNLLISNLCKSFLVTWIDPADRRAKFSIRGHNFVSKSDLFTISETRPNRWASSAVNLWFNISISFALLLPRIRGNVYEAQPSAQRPNDVNGVWKYAWKVTKEKSENLVFRWHEIEFDIPCRMHR